MLEPEIVVPEVQVMLELVFYLMEPAQSLNLRKAEKNTSTICMAKKRHEIGMEKKINLKVNLTEFACCYRKAFEPCECL